MKTSPKGRKLIQQFESLKLEAYKPTPNDVWTIGYGTTRIDDRPVKEGESINRQKADTLFSKDLEYFEEAIERLVKVEITQNQFDALVSFVYNIGIGAFARSTLLKRLNKENFEAAAKEFSRWNKQNRKVLRGLTIRREAERELFAKDIIEVDDSLEA